MSKIIGKYWQFLAFLAVSLAVRLGNIKEALYFTWDNGRDFFAIAKIAQGDVTLIGPTTGLQGIYLGPFWFYLGLPGYLISQGNPYIFLLFYIGVALLVLPFFWYLAHLLFPDKKYLAVTTAYMLSLVPGSIWGTTRVWNPQIGILVVTLFYLSLVKARKNYKFLALAGLLAGLLMQSQLAYGVFFVITLPLLVRFVRRRFALRDYIWTFAPLGLTLIPQILFELKNNFLMSRALLSNLTGQAGGKKLTWLEHFMSRPWQLITSTQDITIRGGEFYRPLFIILLILILFAIYTLLANKKLQKALLVKDIFAWQLMAILALLPYPFYLFWRGNNGFFFDYYITAHYVFIIPLLILGIFSFPKLFPKLKKYFNFSNWLIVATIFVIALQFIWTMMINPINNTGLRAMDESVGQIFTWMDEDEQNPGVVRIFVPNTQTEHYDVITHWRAKQKNRPAPLTILSDEELWYTLIEPAGEQVVLYSVWQKDMEERGELIRQEKVGDLIVQTWKKHE